VWATGLAGPDGTANLTGYAWTGAVADRYWLTLDPAPGRPPGLTGSSRGAERHRSRPTRGRVARKNDAGHGRDQRTGLGE
jgi:hypothetical protein